MASQSTKKEQRIENKKRKITAFLRLVEDPAQGTRKEGPSKRSLKRQELLKDECKTTPSVYDVNIKHNGKNYDDGTSVSAKRIKMTNGNQTSQITKNGKAGLHYDGKGTSTLQNSKDLTNISLDELKARVKKAHQRIQLDQKFNIRGHSLCYRCPNPFSDPIFVASNDPASDALCVEDVRNLVSYALLNAFSQKPSWCNAGDLRTISCVNMIVIDNICINDIYEHHKLFKKSAQHFAHSDLLRLAVLKSFPKELVKQQNEPGNGKKPSKLDLLLNPVQMISEGYPVPDDVTKKLGFKFTKDVYTKVTADSPMFSLDCEMCMTINESSALTRVSIVNEKYTPILDTLVKPESAITNYLTQYSGITPPMMVGVTTTLTDVQETIRKQLPSNAILVGQSLNFDLNALKLVHPYVIDTAIIYNISGDRNKKTSLKNLSSLFLNESIQQGRHGHDSIEDSSYALKLVHLKLNKGINFGDVIVGYQPENETNLIPLDGFFTRMQRFKKSVCIISSDKTISRYLKCDKEATVKRVSRDDITKVESATVRKIKKLKPSLTISHVSAKLPLEQSIQDIDSLISSVYGNRMANALVVVVFTGITSHGISNNNNNNAMGLLIPMV